MKANRIGQVWRYSPNVEWVSFVTPIERFDVEHERDEPHIVLNLVSGKTCPMNLHDIENDPVWTRIA